MVSALLADALTSPTISLLQLYEDFKRSEIENGSGDFPIFVSKYFSSVFATQDAFCQIPLLDVSHPIRVHDDRALVRFRAMIQDNSISPEMYLTELSDGKCGGWGIAEKIIVTGSELSSQVDWGNMKERSVLWAVNIPGESSWCSKTLDGEYFVGDNASLPGHIQDTNLIADNLNNLSKALKFPIPRTRHIAIPVKIYDKSADLLSSTDIMTFVGILSLTDSDSKREDDTDLSGPVLHVLFTSPLPKTLIPSSYPYKDYSLFVRERLVSWLATEALGNDVDAAEWILLCCIAFVQSRTPLIIPPSLTLSNFPKPPTSGAIPTLCRVLTNLLPLFTVMPLSLDYLNFCNFAPISIDEDLRAGALQLPKGTVTVVTENDIHEGQLMEKGVHNVQVIRDLIKTQQLRYEFPYSDFNMQTDQSFIFISEGKKSIVCETDINVSLKLDPHVNLYKDTDNVSLPTPEELTSFRNLIAGSKCGTVRIGDDVSQYIQTDFVEERRNDSSTSANDLMRRITIARLMALSFHQLELTQQSWTRAKELDLRCVARLTHAI